MLARYVAIGLVLAWCLNGISGPICQRERYLLTINFTMVADLDDQDTHLALENI